MSETTSRIPLLTRRGICLPEIGLWLDPWDRQERAFVSHAHSDHFGAHGTIVASKATAALIEARFRGAYTLEPHMFGRAWTWRGHRLMLLPAGHTLGSAQIHVTRLSDGATLLYTGDFKLRRSRTSEVARLMPADTLIMETTFGRSHFRFPSTTKVRHALIRFCRECLDDGDVPVLVAYALGKAQEIMAQLADAGFSFALHPSVFEMTEVYAAQGVALPPYVRHDPDLDLGGRVLIAPPSAARSQALRQVRQRRLAMCTGWALTPGAKFRYQVDEVFPLSDHADYPELLACVEQVKPTLVLTTHGYAAEFARDLRERGYEAWSLGADDQLEFAFGFGGAGQDGAEEEALVDAESMAASEYGRFVMTCDAVAAAASRRQKVGLLSAYFRTLEDDAGVAVSARFFCGRAATTREEQKLLATGWTVIRLALLGATGVGVKRYREIAAAQNDVGRTAYLMLLHGQKASPRPMALADLTACVDRLITARGPVAKAAVLETFLRQVTPVEGQYLVKILTNDLRIGLKDGLIEEALADAFAADPAAVREAHMLTGDIGEAARLARRRDLSRAGLALFQPLRPMLPVPAESAEDVWNQMNALDEIDGGREAPLAVNEPAGNRAPVAPLWIELTLNGIRAQLHKRGPRVELFSQDLHTVSAEFPEVVGPAALLADDVVLDGELVVDGPPSNGRWRPDRLGGRQPDLFGAGGAPARFVAFDLLWHNGESLLLQPLRIRRARLEEIVLVPPLEMIGVDSAASPADVKAAALASAQRGHHGVIAKDPAGPYAAGRRSRSWLALTIRPADLTPEEIDPRPKSRRAGSTGRRGG